MWTHPGGAEAGLSGVARIYMGVSRALSRAVYGESAGGILEFDHAIGTPSTLVAVRVSRLISEGFRGDGS